MKKNTPAKYCIGGQHSQNIIQCCTEYACTNNEPLKHFIRLTICTFQMPKYTEIDRDSYGSSHDSLRHFEAIVELLWFLLLAAVYQYCYCYHFDFTIMQRSCELQVPKMSALLVYVHKIHSFYCYCIITLLFFLPSAGPPSVPSAHLLFCFLHSISAYNTYPLQQFG